MNVALNILRRKKCGKKSSALVADTYAKPLHSYDSYVALSKELQDADFREDLRQWRHCTRRHKVKKA